MLLMMEGLKRKDGAVDWIELPSHERIIIFSSTVSHTERGKLGNFYQRFPPSKVLYPVLFVVTLRPVSLILSCRRRKGGKKRWQRRKNAKMQKGNTSPRTVHFHSLCEADWGEWWIIRTLYMAWRDSALWKCTRGHCQCTGLGCIRQEEYW